MNRLKAVFELLLLAKRNELSWVAVPVSGEDTAELHEGWISRHVLAAAPYGGSDLVHVLGNLKRKGIELERKMIVPKGGKRSLVHYKLVTTPTVEDLRSYDFLYKGNEC